MDCQDHDSAVMPAGQNTGNTETSSTQFTTSSRTTNTSNIVVSCHFVHDGRPAKSAKRQGRAAGKCMATPVPQLLQCFIDDGYITKLQFKMEVINIFASPASTPAPALSSDHRSKVPRLTQLHHPQSLHQYYW